MATKTTIKRKTKRRASPPDARRSPARRQQRYRPRKKNWSWWRGKNRERPEVLFLGIMAAVPIFANELRKKSWNAGKAVKRGIERLHNRATQRGADQPFTRPSPAMQLSRGPEIRPTFFDSGEHQRNAQTVAASRPQLSNAQQQREGIKP